MITNVMKFSRRGEHIRLLSFHLSTRSPPGASVIIPAPSLRVLWVLGPVWFVEMHYIGIPHHDPVPMSLPVHMRVKLDGFDEGDSLRIKDLEPTAFPTFRRKYIATFEIPCSPMWEHPGALRTPQSQYTIASYILRRASGTRWMTVNTLPLNKRTVPLTATFIWSRQRKFKMNPPSFRVIS